MGQEERLLSVSEVLKILNIPRHKLVYLFECRKLKSEEFMILDNGHKVFRQGDIEKIRKALWEVGMK
ncbi:MAG TPA: hypothetical protein ACFYEF_00360 [Candidatus Wunengus sp. YC63]|uniref:hypothetical protein n=1 Tax=unclassified Candidatus Wunengus TaxID=3367695 RepID=UPI004024D249